MRGVVTEFDEHAASATVTAEDGEVIPSTAPRSPTGAAPSTSAPRSSSMLAKLGRYEATNLRKATGRR